MSDPPAQPRQRAPIRFPSELPISARAPEIERALGEHQVIIVVGATGSGKTTQLPKVALAAGRGGKRQIGVTQPRRIAATSVAARVAEELECELGREVGYQIRFEDRSSAETWVKFMTDGILLAEVQSDPLLDGYDTLIIDEAHERSLNIDFLLGWLKRILPKRRDLKVIVSSATLEAERFSQFFDGAPVISVEGRTFGVEVLYEPPPDDLDLSEATAAAVKNITSLDPRGDILVFLPGEREIRETEQALLAAELRHTVILPLYSRLAAGDQARVFKSISERRVILATNVAETSLTIPGIVYVVDTGIARLSRYDARTGTTRLQLEAISQASAEQRKGRCGRVREGICVRLFDEPSFASRPEYTDPEIKRTGLAGVILRMKALGLGAVEDFPFLDPPQSRSITEGYRVLQELGALDDEQKLTKLGYHLSRFPLDPRLARMIVAGAEFDCLDEILVLAAALELQDPRERPRGLESKADAAHARFRDERSDFVGLLKLWAFVRDQAQKSTGQLRRACKDNFLSFIRVREWREVHRQLRDVVRELRLVPHRDGKPRPREAQADDESVHLALLSGLLSRIGQWNAEHRIYVGARQTRFMVHPSSGLAKKPPAWVMAFELVETSQLFARTAARIDPVWLDRVGGHLLKRSYSEPHWSEKSARASVREHATLFGLPVLRDRSIDYSTIEPGRARLLFIEHALVRGEYKSRGTFQEQNRRVLAEVARLRDKARQSDMLADDEALLSFFDRRVPKEVVNGKTFEHWREQAEKKDSKLLYLDFTDVVGNDRTLSPEQYPDVIELRGVELPVRYRFEPSADDDGAALDLPLALLPQLEPSELDGTIPAWREQKIAALLGELPRVPRLELGNAPELKRLAAELARRLDGTCGSLQELLSQSLLELRKITIEPNQFRPDAIPRYLNFYFRVLGDRGQVLGEGRNLYDLCERFAPEARHALRSATPQGFQPSGITAWTFDDLPKLVTHRAYESDIPVFPALVDQGAACGIKLFETHEAAARAHLGGVRRLLRLASKSTLSTLDRRMPLPFSLRNGLPPSRTEQAAFAESVRARVTAEAFAIAPGGEVPRTKAAFQLLLTSGTQRIYPVFENLLKVLTNVRTELERTVKVLDTARSQPSGKQVGADVHQQLERLAAPELLLHTDLERLAQLPRYFKAAQARLTRALHDPRKDASKAEPIAAVLRAFATKYTTAADRDAAQRLLFSLEELRVATFAPELRPVQAPSIPDAARAVAELA